MCSVNVLGEKVLMCLSISVVEVYVIIHLMCSVDVLDEKVVMCLTISVVEVSVIKH